MLAVTDRRVHTISVMSCTQLLKTELLNNIVGYFVDQDPSPIIVMQPTEKMAKAWSVDRFDKMIRDTPRLREKFGLKKSRESTNTIQHKTYPGGHVTIIGANAPADLASRPVRVILSDECDRYPQSAGGGASGEGDPILLLSERSATFWNALKVFVCSPTIEGRSRINFEYEKSDKRRYQLECPHCLVQLFPKWKQVRWEKDQPETAQYYCEDCGEAWTEPQRLRAIQKGSWKATAPFKGHAGFHVSKLCSPWEPLSTLAEKFLHAKKDPEKLQVFINTQLAETWKQKGEAPDWQVIYERREHYPIGVVPKGALLLTAGVDIQDKSIEVEIKGWGKDKQSWSVEKFVFHGDTSDERGPWKELDHLLVNQWATEDDVTMPIAVMAVDSGFRTQTVYNWCRRYPVNRVIAVKGSAHAQMLLGHGSLVDVVKKGRRSHRGFKVFTVGVDIAKNELYGLLRLPKPTSEGEPYPPGYCHFPEYDPEHFKQLTAEEIQKKIVSGRTIYFWEKIRPRNEALDLHVYNRAAASFFGIDRFKEHHWAAMDGYSPDIRGNMSPEAVKRKRSTFL